MGMQATGYTNNKLAAKGPRRLLPTPTSRPPKRGRRRGGVMRARVKRNEVRAGSAIRHAGPAQRRPACTRVRRGRTSDDRVEKRVGGPMVRVMKVEGDDDRAAGSVTGRCSTHARRRPA